MIYVGNLFCSPVDALPSVGSIKNKTVSSILPFPMDKISIKLSCGTSH